MNEMDIYTFGKILSEIKIEDIEQSEHFIERDRVRLRMGLENIYVFINGNTPVGILKQSAGKFKVMYEYSKEYDLSIIFSLRQKNPVKLVLVTCLKEFSRNRMR
ncbi:hypothetical protein HWN40_01455 [Methanolobus zinderi]|uniref:Uncharacterized protein n=1 Tax=Methanolobus zinderi TaxID=536044 RepID=A0A7D5I333_9EURY|nr:hypothetical protein [Methanolobus zinderi]QLC49028.1 hypothetical protein HWN40_01455 [Methanolobus zinderi]